MSLSKRVRFEVFKRDRFTCAYCGQRPPDVVLEVDHVHPKCQGGSDEMDNLVTSCEGCNRGKAGKGLGDVAPAVDEMQRLAAMQEMAERASLLQKQREEARQMRALEDEAVEDAMGWWNDIGGSDDSGEHGYRRSLKRFLKSLSPIEIHEAFESTGRMWDRKSHLTQAQAWRYFCGACWSMIREKEGC